MTMTVPLVTRARITDGRLAVAVGRLCGFLPGVVRGTRVRPKAVIRSAASKAAMSTSPPRSMSSTPDPRSAAWGLI